MNTGIQDQKKIFAPMVSWMRDEVLPEWFAKGFDYSNGAAYDLIDWGGVSSPAELKQRLLKNQAKQTYVFSQAERIGWGGGYQGGVHRLIEFASRQGTSLCRSDGYVHSLDQNYSILDGRYDLVDHGYFMLAGGAAYAAFGGGADIRRAYNILEWLDLHFVHELGGWKESSTDNPVRKLSTLGVMLEVFLNFFEMTQKDIWLRRARECYRLFLLHHWNSEKSFAYSSCNDLWQISDSTVIAEEQVQWVFLLQRFLSAGGDCDESIIASLYRRFCSDVCYVSNRDQTLSRSDTLKRGSYKCLSEVLVSIKDDFSVGDKVGYCNLLYLHARLIKANLYLYASGKLTSVSAALASAKYLCAIKSNAPKGFFHDDEVGQSISSVASLYEMFQAIVQINHFITN